MKNKANYIKFLPFMFFLFNTSINCKLIAQDEEVVVEERVFDYAEDNQKCFKCHGHKVYHYYNENTDKTVKERMNPYFLIDSVAFYNSNHWNFACTDCHSTEFENFPHNGELRFEEKPACIDCHGGDDTYACLPF